MALALDLSLIKKQKVVISIREIAPQEAQLKEENSAVMKNIAEATDVLSVSPLLKSIYSDMSI